MSYSSKPSSGNYPESSNSDQIYHKSRIEKIFTPWTVGGLVIIFMTNVMAIQWQEQEKNKALEQEKNKAKPAAVNIAPTIQLQSLSLLKVPKKTIVRVPKKTVETLVLPSPFSTPPAKPTPTASKPVTEKTTSRKTTPTKQAIIKLVENKNNPPLPSVPQGVPQTTSDPQVTPSPENNSKEVEYSILLRQRQAETPLGFNHRTRAKMQAAQTNQDPNVIIENMQQLQQQRIDETTQPLPSSSK